MRGHGVLPRRRRHPRGGPARADLHESPRAANPSVPRALARGGEARVTGRLITDIQKRGFFGYTLAAMLPRGRSRAPLAIAAFIAIPLFFSALMASTLALEKPHKFEWMRGGRLLTTWHDPTQGNVAAIWLWALVPPLVLVVIGLIAMRLPLGFYVPCAAAIVIAI